MVSTRPTIEGTRDTTRIFILRSLRAFGFGFLGVLLALYLERFGFGPVQIGLYLSLATLGGIGTNFAFSRLADRYGRRRILALAALLYTLSGILLAVAQGPVLLLLAAVVGAVPPGGNGLFSAVEQAMLGGHHADRRTHVFALYGFLGSGAMAAGSLAAGLPDLLAAHGWSMMTAFRVMMGLYAVLGLAMVVLAASLGPAVESPGVDPQEAADAAPRRSLFGLGRSHRLMVQMATLFVFDAFGSALVTTTLLVYWLHARFGMSAGHLAVLFAATQVLAAISMLLAVPLARRIGLINTAVWTHIPSSLFLMAVPLMPSAAPAVVLLLARALLVQMDVPTNEAYIASVVDPEERAAAAGVTTMGYQTGQLAGPAVGGVTLAAGALGTFFLAGGIKIAYDLTLWQLFRHVPPRT
ncbi:MAG: MFS transporter [Clostridia bacterium]